MDRASLLARCGGFPVVLQDMLATADAARVRRRTATDVWAPIEYGGRGIGDVVADVRTACRELTDVTRSVSAIQLRRCGVGSDGSPRSVESLLVRAEHEVAHHELDLRRGLGLVAEL